MIVLASEKGEKSVRAAEVDVLKAPERRPEMHWGDVRGSAGARGSGAGHRRVVGVRPAVPVRAGPGGRKGGAGGRLVSAPPLHRALLESGAQLRIVPACGLHHGVAAINASEIPFVHTTWVVKEARVQAAQVGKVGGRLSSRGVLRCPRRSAARCRGGACRTSWPGSSS